ncbi:MAG: hypothetical protein AB1758_25585 [Candidatus Eremiobacterota bacterium]
MLVGTGAIKNGAGYGSNTRGDDFSGHKAGDGQWSLTNQKNGSQFSAERTSVNGTGSKSGWQVTRTDSQGLSSVGDFTVLAGSGSDGSRRVRVYDFNHNGFQPE